MQPFPHRIHHSPLSRRWSSSPPLFSPPHHADSSPAAAPSPRRPRPQGDPGPPQCRCVDSHIEGGRGAWHPTQFDVGISLIWLPPRKQGGLAPAQDVGLHALEPHNQQVSLLSPFLSRSLCPFLSLSHSPQPCTFPTTLQIQASSCSTFSPRQRPNIILQPALGSCAMPPSQLGRPRLVSLLQVPDRGGAKGLLRRGARRPCCCGPFCNWSHRRPHRWDLCSCVCERE